MVFLLLFLLAVASIPLHALDDAFIDWFRVSGGKDFDRVSLQTFGDMGRGVACAAESLAVGDEVLHVPAAIVLSRQTATSFCASRAC